MPGSLNFDLVVLDFDGVLIDSEAVTVEAEAMCLTSAGFPIEKTELVNRFTDADYETIVRVLERRFVRKTEHDLIPRLKREVEESILENVEVVPGMDDLLRDLVGRCCIATSSSFSRLKALLEVTSLTSLVQNDICFCSERVARDKPAPDVFLFAAQQMGVSPSDCVVVEDTPRGILAGLSAGITTIGFTGGSHATASLTKQLADAGANEIAKSSEELQQLLWSAT